MDLFFFCLPELVTVLTVELETLVDDVVVVETFETDTVGEVETELTLPTVCWALHLNKFCNKNIKIKGINPCI